ncbi:MAG: leucine-rich repeat protein, partial [Treponema sp.]|nr:leucine-rich repeat protein [Treponema sp.]
TDLKSLTPDWITYNGADISPGPYAARNFVTPVTYTVVAADGSTAVWTVIVSLQPLTDTGDIGAYLTAAASAYDPDPVPLPVSFGLDGSGWTDLLSAIDTADKDVALDLSACTMTGTQFDPGTASAGNIVSLVLPDTAKSVKAGNNTAPYDGAFKDFTALESVTGAGIETVGAFAFSGCTSLETVNLPAVITISPDAFFMCSGLTTVSLPASLSTIGDNPFTGCTGLTSITVDPGNPYYKHSAGGKALLSKDGKTLIAYPSAAGDLSGDPTLEGITVVGNSALEKTAIAAVHLPAAASVSIQAFEGCDALATVSLPAAADIGIYAFYRCPSLTTVDLPAAEFINQNAFGVGAGGGTALTVTLGFSVPTLGTNMFSGVSVAKNVTVKVPSGATGYGTIPGTYSDANTTNNWGNGFRGGGWNGSAMMNNSYINSKINLTIETYTAP